MEQPSISDAYCSDNRGPLLLVLGWTLLAIALCTVTFRMYFRRGLRNGISWDDYIIVASLVVGIIGASFLTKLVKVGAGKHLRCLPPGQIFPVLKWSLLAQICNLVGIGLVKISVCLCVLRVVDKTQTRISQFLWVLIFFVSASHFAQMIIFLVQCRPIAAMWNPHIEGKCFSAHVTYTAAYANYGIDAFTDLICAVIPIFVIHRLQMNLRTKMALSLLMGLGVFTAGCALAKAITLKAFYHKDYTWDITQPAVWTITEHYVGITIASMPALRPLFTRVLDAALTSPGPNKAAFQKISASKKPNTTSCVPRSSTISAQSSIRGNNIRKTVEFRVSSQLDLEIYRDEEFCDDLAIPDFLDRSRRRSFSEYDDDVPIQPGGYRHIDLPVPASAHFRDARE